MVDQSGMSLDPINLHPAVYNNIFPYHQPNLWMNFTRPGFCVADSSMPSQQNGGCYGKNHSSEAHFVYEAKSSEKAQTCVKITTNMATDSGTYDLTRMRGVDLPSEYQLFGISNPLDTYASRLTKQESCTIVPYTEDNTRSVIMPKPLHRVPMSRQQHYHQRHHAQLKHLQANNLKNKTRFSATGLSSSCAIVRDTKMSLSSAPSSPSAGSVGGSLGNNYPSSHSRATASAAFSMPQCKGCSSSSSSSCCSNSGLKISSTSLSSYSSSSSMSSTASLSGISPRKRRADDVVTNYREGCCRKGFSQRPLEADITGRCSCEVCATDEVTAGVDDVTIRDVVNEEHAQQLKRSKNDGNVFLSVSGPAICDHAKERQTRKTKKSSRKTAHHQTMTVEQRQSQSYTGFPFVVPAQCPPVHVESRDVAGRYFLRSVVKGRKHDDSVMNTSPSHATFVQSGNNVGYLIKDSHISPKDADGTNENTEVSECAVSQRPPEKATFQLTPRYHTRSQQKKANAGQHKIKAQIESPTSGVALASDQTTNCQVTSGIGSYQAASVIQSAVATANCSKQSYVRTSFQATTDSSKETQRFSFSLKKLYDIHGIIGVGGGGTVYAGTRKSDGMQVAIKQVPKAKVKRWGKLNGRTVPIEFELLYRASHSGHSGVIRMLDWYERRSTYILVMERPQPVIDLFDYLNQYGALSEASARAIFRQIAKAVLHCHANGVVHRDIKDENVILNLHTSEAKLIDFGCGTVLKNTPYTEFAGTPEFYPPEWFTHRRYHGRRVDAWSLGVLLFTMVEAEVPFQKEKDIVECNLRHKRAAHLSDRCRSLIAWMLQKDQDARPTIEQALSHPWLRDIDAPLREATETSTNGIMSTVELYEERIVQHPNSGSNESISALHARVGPPKSTPRHDESMNAESMMY